MSEEKSIQSLGGEARAKALSAEERSENARAAALARWENTENRTKLPQARFGSPDRPLRIGNLEIPCYVLDDGRRVISQGGVLTALSMGRGTATKGGGDRIRNFLSTKSLNQFVANELRDVITEPIKFKIQGGSLAYGYEAVILPDICDAVLEARKNGTLNYQQEHIAKQCEILVRAFARVGIIALVDEATGYQEVRDREALQEILKKYVDGALYEWTKTFPLALYKEIFRLKGWAWNSGKIPSVVGHYTNDIVYDRITPGLKQELRRLNPVTEKGRRKHKHFQFLTRDLGHPALTQRIYELLGMARASKDWNQFYRLVERIFPKVGATMLLSLDDEPTRRPDKKSLAAT